MSIKSKAKKLGRAIIFIKLFEEIKANKEKDISKLKELIGEWEAESPDDLNCVLASILVDAEEGTIEDPKAEFEEAKAQYNAEDLDSLPWFESQIENLTAADEEAAEE